MIGLFGLSGEKLYMTDSALGIKRSDIIVATLLRRHGETGLQTHINELGRFVEDRNGRFQVLNPFGYHLFLVYPVFAVRKLLQYISGPMDVWWYRTFHYLFLRLVLSNRLKTEDCPIIYASCPVSAKAAIRSRRNADQKVTMTVQFNRSQAYEWELRGRIKAGDWVYRGIERLEEEVLPSLDALVFVSDFMRTDLERRIPATKAVKSTVIPNFVAVPEASEARGIKGDLISIGTLEPRKNQAYLLKVLVQANKLGYRYSLTLIGDGEDRSRLGELANELGLQDQVTFLGFQPHAAQYLPGHRAYVHSSLMESFGLVLIEAMAIGLPVLAGPAGGIPEVFSDGVEGVYWPLDDPESGARKLIGLLENAEAYVRVARAAKRRYERDFATEIVADKLVTFLSEIGASGKRDG